MGTVHGQNRRRAATLLGAASIVAMLAAGCVPGSGPAAGGGSDGKGTATAEADAPPLEEIGESASQDLPTDPAEDPAYSAYYEQSVDWGDCDDSVPGAASIECGTVTVPRVWDDPSAGDIDLAVVRSAATGEAKGSLLMNPGGPGGSGVDFVAESGSLVVSADVREAYDLVGFDPRGVYRSAGIECLEGEALDELRAGEPGTSSEPSPELLEEIQDESEEVSASCEADSADMLPYMDTYSAARDLDVLRSAVGSEKLDYLGYSYGTYLGATYADLYPARVGRFVLDGALDPTITGDELSRGQAEGFEKATAAFVEDCLSRGSDICPLKGSVEDATGQITALFESLDAEPLPTKDPDRPLTGDLARSGLLLTLYSDENWSLGVQGLQHAMEGDGSTLLLLADLGAERQDDGTYTGNSSFAISAVNCLDHPAVPDESWQVEEAQSLAEEFPPFGDILGFADASCEGWAGPVREPAPISAAGSDLIVVIGTTGDPATPYEWSVSLDEQLENSTLITYEGQGHTAYGRSGGCVEDAVDAYLLEGTAPGAGLTCS